MTAFSNSGLTEMTNFCLSMFFADLAPSTLLMYRNGSYIVNKSLLNIKVESVEMNSSPIVYFVLSHFLLCLLDHAVCTAACRHHSPGHGLAAVVFSSYA